MAVALFLQPLIARSKLHVPILKRLLSCNTALPTVDQSLLPQTQQQLYDPSRWTALPLALGIEPAEDSQCTIAAAVTAANHAICATSAQLSLLRSSAHLLAVSTGVNDDRLVLDGALKVDCIIDFVQRAHDAWRECIVRTGAAAAEPRAYPSQVSGSGVSPARLGSSSAGIGGWKSLQKADTVAEAADEQDESWLPRGLTVVAAAEASHTSSLLWVNILEVALLRHADSEDSDDLHHAPSLATLGRMADEVRCTAPYPLITNHFYDIP